MKVYTADQMPQGSHEWVQARLGIPTASQADRLMTPKSKKPSASQAKYRAELLAEYLQGQPLDAGSSGFMERGKEDEDEARKWYEFERDTEVEQVGFVTRDDGLFGGSPDGLVGDDGIVEIKVPAIHTHVFYMLGEDPDYMGQCQSYIYLMDRQWVDVVSYHHHLPSVVNRVERDEEYIEPFVEILDRFLLTLEEDKKRLAHHRIVRPWDDAMKEEMAAVNAGQAVMEGVA